MQHVGFFYENVLICLNMVISVL